MDVHNEVSESGAQKDLRPTYTSTLSLVAVVLIAGAAIMIYEFIAVRILARWFGNSLDVWASVISVLLAGLSIGYGIGGILADRFGSVRPIAVALILSGGLGIVMEDIAIAIGEKLSTVDWGLTLHPYIAAMMVSFLPILFLGTVVPQAIRLRAQTTQHIGRAAGFVSGLSTFGSIVGVVLTVHFLIPYVGVRETIIGFSVFLILTGIFLAALRSRKKVLTVCLFLIFISNAHADILYEDYSAYHHIIVEDTGNERILWFDDAAQSTMSRYDYYSGGFEYLDFFHVPMILNPTVSSVLFIGLGGGSGPKTFLRDYPEVQIKVVEIDPEVLNIAQKFFYLPKNPRLKVTIRDGRVYLQRSQRKYGAIMLDAYTTGRYGAYLPYHLITQEYFRIVWDKLDNGGSLVCNVVGVHGGDLSDVIENIYTTLSSVFQAVYVFEAKSSINTVFVAQKIGGVTENIKQDPKPPMPWPQGPWLRHPISGSDLASLTQTLVNQQYIRNGLLVGRVIQLSSIHGTTPKGLVYTDNFAPIDISSGQQNKKIKLGPKSSKKE